MTERLYILDSDGNLTGRECLRGTKLKDDEYNEIVHVWILNSRGELLISQRAPTKSYPDKWETTCGCVTADETGIKGGCDSALFEGIQLSTPNLYPLYPELTMAAAIREVKEELGVSLSPSCGRLIGRFRYPREELPAFSSVWLFAHDVDIKDIVLQPGETNDARWVSPEGIRGMIKSGEFIGYDFFPYLDELFAALTHVNIT